MHPLDPATCAAVVQVYKVLQALAGELSRTFLRVRGSFLWDCEEDGVPQGGKERGEVGEGSGERNEELW